MKLLFAQNLSFKLCERLTDVFPGSEQVRRLGLDRADDRELWKFARANNFTIVSQDSDFADMAVLYGPPPKIIWLRCGNQTTDFVEQLFRGHAKALVVFEQDADAACWELY